MSPLEALKQLAMAVNSIPGDTELPYHVAAAIRVAVGNALTTITQTEKADEQEHKALLAFVDTVNATGGVVFGSDGRVETVGDPDWMDLADAYILACEALGVKPNEKKEGA